MDYDGDRPGSETGAQGADAEPCDCRNADHLDAPSGGGTDDRTAGAFALLFDFAAMAALIWALVNVYQLWRARREEEG